MPGAPEGSGRDDWKEEAALWMPVGTAEPLALLLLSAEEDGAGVADMLEASLVLDMSCRLPKM